MWQIIIDWFMFWSFSLQKYRPHADLKNKHPVFGRVVGQVFSGSASVAVLQGRKSARVDMDKEKTRRLTLALGQRLEQ